MADSGRVDIREGGHKRGDSTCGDRGGERGAVAVGYVGIVGIEASDLSISSSGTDLWFDTSVGGRAVRAEVRVSAVFVNTAYAEDAVSIGRSVDVMPVGGTFVASSDAENHTTHSSYSSSSGVAEVPAVHIAVGELRVVVVSIEITERDSSNVCARTVGSLESTGQKVRFIEILLVVVFSYEEHIVSVRGRADELAREVESHS